MYMFGGINDENNFTDDFYWISCDIKANQKFIDKKQGEFKVLAIKPEVRLLARRIVPEGRGPIARAQHSTTFFKN